MCTIRILGRVPAATLIPFNADIGNPRRGSFASERMLRCSQLIGSVSRVREAIKVEERKLDTSQRSVPQTPRVVLD
ncbi:hypothetical protein J6590_024226 [Homalodisca vitripennis]|nr:hypothetical protein J6590_024226 [Homalodisca vitripennis]